MVTTTNKPAIRFENFTDAWEQRRLGELFDPIPNNTLSRADLNYESGAVRNVHYGDILVKFGAVTDCRIDNIPFVTSGSIDDYKSQLLRDGDIIFADTAEDETTGKATEIAGIGDGSVVSGLHTMACRPKIKTSPNYMGYYLNSPAYRRQLLPLMQGVKVLSISRTNLAKTVISYPASEQEQAQIGATFCALDRLITLHQREYDKTVSIKKAMLEKMFPKDGEDKPEIRFAGFTDAWEQRRLGELAEFAKGQGYSKGNLREKGTPIILYGRLYTKYETVITDVDTFVIENEKSVFSKGGEVIVPASGETAEDISRASVVENAGVILGGDLNIVKPKAEIDPAFLAITISNGTQQTELSKRAQGKSVVHLHNSDLQEVQLRYPKLGEQKKIRLLFCALDRLITLHQRELEKLQNMKKALLEKMFIQES